MNKKLIFFGLNIFSICLAFLVGYYLEKNEHINLLNQEKTKPYFIEMKQTKEKLEIKNPYPNVKIKINGENLSESGITIR